MRDSIRIVLLPGFPDEGSVLTIEDSGAGFTRGDEGEPHIALENLTERLRMMCSASLSIEARDGGGTKVTVVIPLQQPPTVPEAGKKEESDPR